MLRAETTCAVGDRGRGVPGRGATPPPPPLLARCVRARARERASASLSPRADRHLQQIADALVVLVDDGLEARDLGELLLDLLVDLGLLKLQRQQHRLRLLLLALELVGVLARLALPLLELAVHQAEVLVHVVHALAERIRRLAQHLNRRAQLLEVGVAQPKVLVLSAPVFLSRPSRMP